MSKATISGHERVAPESNRAVGRLPSKKSRLQAPLEGWETTFEESAPWPTFIAIIVFYMWHLPDGSHLFAQQNYEARLVLW